VLTALAEGGPATATALAPSFGVSRQAVVKHLGVLGEAGLVVSERSGREVHYRAQAAPLLETAEWLASTGASWDRRLDRLRRRLGRSAASK
jgi:DNA-binding transcriptional ArsR family regulator